MFPKARQSNSSSQSSTGPSVPPYSHLQDQGTEPDDLQSFFQLKIATDFLTFTLCHFRPPPATWSIWGLSWNATLRPADVDWFEPLCCTVLPLWKVPSYLQFLPPFLPSCSISGGRSDPDESRGLEVGLMHLSLCVTLRKSLSLPLPHLRDQNGINNHLHISGCCVG